jgi:hypothetical protein
LTLRTQARERAGNLEGEYVWGGGVLDLKGTFVSGFEIMAFARFDIVGTGRPDSTGRPGTGTDGWEYRYQGHVRFAGGALVPILVGSVIRAKPHGNSPAGSVYPFIAVKRQPTSGLSGSWIYRNFNPAFVEGDQTPLRERQLIRGEGVFKLETPTSTTLKGAFEWPGGFLDLLNRTVQPGAGGEPSSFEIVGTGRPNIPTADWEYHYHGHPTRNWPNGLVGSVIRVKPHNGVPIRSPAGEVFSFIAVKQP